MKAFILLSLLTLVSVYVDAQVNKYEITLTDRASDEPPYGK